MKFKTSKPGLKERLQAYMEKITPDIFQYEEKVTKNVCRYLHQQAQFYQLPVKQIKVRIFLLREESQFHLFSDKAHLGRIAEKELVDFFLGKGASLIWNQREKIQLSILDFLLEYAKEKEVPIHELFIQILLLNNNLQIRSYHKIKFLENIPIKRLIQFFRK